MKVSVSAPPDAGVVRSATRVQQALPWLLAAAYLAAHLPFLAPTLEDIDSLNFALGLREFSPALHQPHPPGYPIFIVLGRLALAVVHVLRPQLGRVPSEALALSVWSALGGALSIVFASRVFALIAAPDRRPTSLWATVLLACSPLFWMSGLRPMSDMPGLAAALGTQALLLRAARRDDGPETESAETFGRGTSLALGAFLAGLALGVRSQTLWLTLPLLIYAMALQPSAGRRRAVARACAAYAAGVFAWAIPLLVATGGLSAYMAALTSQAGDDFAFVDMLFAHPTPRQLALTLYRTFAMPWSALPLAAVVLVAAVAGGLTIAVRDRRVLLSLTIAFVPYLLFHLVFQETITVRYALPVLPLVAFAAMWAVALAGRLLAAVALPIAVAALLVAIPGGAAYGRDPHPAFRAIDDIADRAGTSPPAFLTSHLSLMRSLRAADLRNVQVRIAPGTDTRLDLVKYWVSGGTAAVWFLADPRRTDLELIDPSDRTDVVRYQWSVEDRLELSGTRPRGADWYRFEPPRWFLGEGWSLTPEAGGVVAATGKGPDSGPIVGYARRGPEPMRLMVGGRHLGSPADGAADFEMAIDGTVVDRWTLTFDQRNFLRFLELPDGVPAGEGRYAQVTVVSRPAPGAQGRRVPVAVRQFDLQPAAGIVWGFGPGWHEAEYVFETGLRWRWASDRSVIQVRGPARATRITLRGESPRRYFDTAPTVTITAAGRVFGRLQPSADFAWSVVIPVEAMRAASGDIAVETTRVFTPLKTSGSADTRRLGLRIYECFVGQEPASRKP